MSHRESIWKTTTSALITCPKLTTDCTVDVAIIGSGITAITTAWQLTKAGKKVAIFEAHALGEGTTGNSTANLYVPVQPSYQQLLKRFGLATIKAVYKSRKHAIEYIERLCQEQQIACNFTARPLFLYTNNKKYNRKVEREVQALQLLGADIDFCHTLPFALPFTRAAMLKGQARFNPYYYCQRLAERLIAAGCQIYEHSPVHAYKAEPEQVVLQINAHTVHAKQLVLATHTPLGIQPLHGFVYPYRSYALALELPTKSYPNAMLWDMDDSFHSISTHNVLSGQIDRVIVSGSSHKLGFPKQQTTQAHYESLTAYTSQHFPTDQIENQWSAQHYQSADDLPYIGFADAKQKNVLLATGFHADGLVYGTVAGLLMSDLILGKINALAPIYDPHRSKKWGTYFRALKENSAVLWDYIRNYFKFLRHQPFSQVAPGEAKVVNWHGKKCAVYRDANEQLSVVSAVCTHMGCIVKWNQAETTWDCPCHGSRFSVDGQVIEGPACKPLEAYPKFEGSSAE